MTRQMEPSSSPDSGVVPQTEEEAPVCTPSSEPHSNSRVWTGILKLLSNVRRRAFTLRMLVLASLVAVTWVAVMSHWWWTCGRRGCPTPAELQAWHPGEGGLLLARDSSVVGALSVVRRVNVPLSVIPRHVRNAFVAVEDRRFYLHHGIDWRGVARAAISNMKSGSVREGASTITMQLARNVFLGNRAAERSWSRKLLELRYTQLLESALSKDQILERYLNAIYLGSGVYGVEAASRDLFGKGVEGLTLAEAALLAGLPKAPSTYSPRNSMAKALWRRAVVLDVLERERFVESSELNAARHTPLLLASREFVLARAVDSWAVEAVRPVLDSLRAAAVIPVGLEDGQLRVLTTIDRRAQAAAERAIAGGAAQIDAERRAIGRAVAAAGDRTQGALVALDPENGAVRAIVGGRYIERKGFNRALRAQRQPGSAFKPFVYAAALMHGYTPASMVEDEPVVIAYGGNLWRPANHSGEYAGRITLRDALARSSNAAAVRVSDNVGVSAVAALAHAQGIASDLPLVPALALGAAAVTPLELTASYAVFANGGTRVMPHVVERVEDQFGHLLWERVAAPGARVLEESDAFLVTSLLGSVVDQGTGRSVREAGVRGPVAGKTGTTNDGADVWFVGYSPTLVAAVWFGADNPQPLGWNATGGRLAAPVWARFLQDGWHSPENDAPWLPPPGIESWQIDIGTGKLASDWCGPSRREYFKAGTQPRISCETEIPFALLRRGFLALRGSSSGNHADLASEIGSAVSTIRGMDHVRVMTDRLLQKLQQAGGHVRTVTGRVMKSLERTMVR